MHITINGKYAGRFKCFACSIQGDVVDLASLVLGCDLPSALSWLDGQARREPLPKPKPHAPLDVAPLNEDLTSFASEAFHRRSDAAVAWLVSRGLGPVMDTFRLGSTDAPGFDVALLPQNHDKQTGRAYQHKNFLNRLIIPYLTPISGVSYVNARALGEQKPKYLKPARPQGGGARPYLLDMMLAMSDEILIAEGELDCLSIHAALPGVAACALPGTQTLRQGDELLFEDKKVFIVMDNDAAGLKAREELERRLQPYARSVSQLHLPPQYNDVNELLVGEGRRYTTGYLDACIKEAVKRKVYRTV